MRFQEKLERLLQGRKIKDVADLAGVGRTLLTKYRTKNSVPSGPTALKIARALGVSVEWLLDDEQDWIAPAEQGFEGIKRASSEHLRDELARRYIRQGEERAEVSRLLAFTDWRTIAEAAFSRELSDPLPSDVTTVIDLTRKAWSRPQDYLFDARGHALKNRAEISSDGLSLEQFQEEIDRLAAKWQDDPWYKKLMRLHVLREAYAAHAKQGGPSEREAKYFNKEKREILAGKRSEPKIDLG